MGFYLKKALNLKALKINLSKSGIGASIGIPGFRVGTNGKSTYVHAGKKGLYYKKSITNNKIEHDNSKTSQLFGFLRFAVIIGAIVIVIMNFEYIKNNIAEIISIIQSF